MLLGNPPRPKTVRTASGRIVGYYEYGDAEGAPVLAMHGTPASGGEFVFLDEPARRIGLRVIAPDRPGIGISTPVRPARWTVRDDAPEVAATADALGIARFAVLGYSGGGPFALATAHAFPERVAAAAIVSGGGQIGEWARLSDFDATDAPLTFLADRAPLVAQMFLIASAWSARLAPRASDRFVRWQLPRADRDAMQQYTSSRAALAPFTNAFTHTAVGVVADYAASARAWGFDVRAITRPVRCYHGTDDRTVPFRHSEELVARVPGSDLVAWPGLAHLAINDRANEVLEWLATQLDVGRSGDDDLGRSDHAAR